ncbi:hypothetical protein [Streptomyces sp. NPDC093109]|uniref:hypothetical protein n=1 Tax=Streptomyces sp. NPDC093109 TaxID=3154977 RepID=UPI003450EDCA
MKKLLARTTAALATAASLVLMPLAASPARAAVAADHPGMTWSVVNKGSDGTVQPSSDAVTDAYNGDTPASETLPVLCLRITNAPLPASVTPDFYTGWARGTVAATPPVQGSTLTGRAVADALCAQYYGPGWRMAEFHDGRYGPDLSWSGGWSFWAHGYLPENTRFWVAIDDQAANPWN